MSNQLNHGLKLLSNHVNGAVFLLKDVFRLYNIVSPTEALNWSFVVFCKFVDPICKVALGGVADREVPLDNMSRDDVYYSMFPSGCGWRNFAHYGQLIKSGGFFRYDYGKKENLVEYGQEKPPAYDLQSIDLPVALLHGDTDVLSDVKDVQWLVE